MTSEQRLDRVERILILFVSAGRRAREKSREQDEKINILIQTQMETSEMVNRTSETVDRTSETINRMSETINRTSETTNRASEMINSLAIDHAVHDKEMAELRREQKLTQQALRAFINSLRKGKNSKSSN